MSNLWSPVLFVLFLSQVLATPSRTTNGGNAAIPIRFDLYSPLPDVVKVSASREDPLGHYYQINPEVMDLFRIGAISNGTQILMEDMSTNVGKTIFHITLYDGSEYLRVKSLDLVPGDVDSANPSTGAIKTLYEFTKPLGSEFYTRITREPIGLDLSMKDPFLVDVIQNEPGLLTYRVKVEVRNIVRIARIRYGQHIIDDRVDGILQKEITVDHRGVYPEITITSYIKSGLIKKSKYEFAIGNSPEEHGYSLVDVELDELF